MTTKRKHKYLRWHPPGTSTLTEHELPAHDPLLTPHDEAVFLLHIAAEVEHALLVQYLYAAYSLKAKEEVPPERQAQVRAWKKTLLGIAREEMGHLITVQNLLRLIGGPITLDREDYPFRSDLYPFHFRLEPVSKHSLAKYVVAEMPFMANPPDEIKEVTRRASSADTVPINRVGAIYLRLSHIFSPPGSDQEPHLSDADFLPDISARQAYYADWGNGDSVLIPEVRNRQEALAAIEALAEQGEGLSDSTATPSHYQRFLEIYREFPEEGDWQPTYAVPTNPNTSPATQHGLDPEQDEGRITDRRSRLWAQLSNSRYRLLLSYLSHFLQTEGPLLDSDSNYTPRGFLYRWTFDEMRRVSQLAGKLATMPRLEGQPDLPGRAGAPFELPYTLDLPDREPDRWRLHLDALSASAALVRHIQDNELDASDHFLEELARLDNESRQVMQVVAAGEELPPQPTAFKKVVQTLEDAVRGFPIGEHHNFWRDCNRDEFISKSIFGNPLIAQTADGRFDAENSNLLKALRGEPPFDAKVEAEEDDSHYPRMPAHHPPVPPAGIEFIRRWIEAGCPDNDPPGQVGIVGESGEAKPG